MGKLFLIPVDGSKASMGAVEFGLTIVSESDQIVLLNVQKPLYEGLNQLGNFSSEQLNQFYKKRGEEILYEPEQAVIKKNISVQKVIRIGLPSLEITKAANELSAHSIIMGSKGMSASVNNALGSVTYGVIHIAPCPITIVPFNE